MFYIKRMFWLCLMLFVSGSGLSAQRQRTYPATPPNAELDRYPLKDTVLTQAEMTTLGVRPLRLSIPWVGFNWFRDKRRFAYDSLPAGTLVLVDSAGKLRYKADCGNRLVERMEIMNAVATTNSQYAVMPDSSKLYVLLGPVNLAGNLKLEHSFPPEFYKALAERQTVTVVGPPPSQPSVVQTTTAKPRGFISRHKWWFIGGGALLLGYGIYECTDGDGCYLMVNRQIIRE